MYTGLELERRRHAIQRLEALTERRRRVAVEIDEARGHDQTGDVDDARGREQERDQHEELGSGHRTCSLPPHATILRTPVRHHQYNDARRGVGIAYPGAPIPNIGGTHRMNTRALSFVLSLVLAGPVAAEPMRGFLPRRPIR